MRNFIKLHFTYVLIHMQNLDANYNIKLVRKGGTILICIKLLRSIYDNFDVNLLYVFILCKFHCIFNPSKIHFTLPTITLNDENLC